MKNRLVPEGPRLWRLPFGVGSGLRIVLDLRHWTVLYLGFYEIELNRYLRRLCRPGFRSFDVGGQNGYDALVLAKLSSARVLSFECDPDLCEAMRASVRANPHLHGIVEVRRAFVTDHTDASRENIALDEVAYGDGSFVPDLIKMDIEGGELAALKGAERILRERRPNLILEMHSLELEEQCGLLLKEVGYRPRVVNPRRWLRDNRPVTHNRWIIAAGHLPDPRQRE